MYKIMISNYAFLKLDAFVNSYKNKFLDLYNDTGIFSEEIIRKNYIDLGDRLKDNVIFGIKQKLIEESILGRKEKDGKIFVIYIKVGNFLIDVSYKEYLDQQERLITNLEFYKK